MTWLDYIAVVIPAAGIAVIALLIARRALHQWWLSLKPETPPIPCPKCSYDLRGNLFFCPECGTELLWGQLPGEQQDYDSVVRRREKQGQRMRA